MRMTKTQRRPVHEWAKSLEVRVRERVGLYRPKHETCTSWTTMVSQSNNNAIAIHNRKCPHHSFIVCDAVTIDGTLDILMHTLDR